MVTTRGELVGIAGLRHGLVPPLWHVDSTFAEPCSVFNVAVSGRPATEWRSTAGGIARTREDAEAAAIGEALERYSAHRCALPRMRRLDVGRHRTLELEDFSLYDDEQRTRVDFPHRAIYERERTYTNAFSLDNAEVWVPFELVGLSTDSAGVATSSGLAAARSALQALLRALQELVERDALMVTWLHGVPGRRVELPPRYTEEVEQLGGEAMCIDATPAYSPHPVAFVLGFIPRRGANRYSLGAACRESWDDAVEKAYLEWLQGVAFVGYYRDFHPHLAFKSRDDVRTFDDHAVYYSVHPEEWPTLPLLRSRPSEPPRRRRSSLAELAKALSAHGIRVYYRELTTCDLRQADFSVVRALSPDLAPIHCDESWPFIGGRVADVAARYRWADERDLCFVNPHPHPLG